ncbi:hypothetical protein MMC08_001458 [Hypocenomyce scalaris]|nr:hypothetical protein [Hypocenomyce scalaris]
MASSLLALRRDLASTLKKEDKLIKEYNRIHESLHTVDRTHRRVLVVAPVIPGPFDYWNYLLDTKRDELKALGAKMGVLTQRRRELLQQIIEMEREEMFGGVLELVQKRKRRVEMRVEEKVMEEKS